jgi:SNF2 family DNA or RNA helicase
VPVNIHDRKSGEFPHTKSFYIKCGEVVRNFIELFPDRFERFVILEGDLQIPQTLAKKLLPHQKKEIETLWKNTDNNALLFWPPGTGKSLPMIGLLTAKIQINQDICVIVSPKSINLQWLQEFTKWVKESNLPTIYVKILKSTQEKETIEEILSGRLKFTGGVLIISPSFIATETGKETIVPFLQGKNASTIVFDEGHLYFNEENSTTVKLFNSFNIKHKYVLDGTPFIGKGQSLVNVVNFLDNSIQFGLSNMFKYEEYITMKNTMTIEAVKTYTEVDYRSISTLEVIHKIEEEAQGADIPKLTRYVIHVPMTSEQTEKLRNYQTKGPITDYALLPEMMEMGNRVHSNKVRRRE